nr:hypothetical protein [Tanacetum cinerariifolium]
DDLIESSLKSKLLSINSNSQPLDKKKQVKNIVEQPVERRTRIEKSLQNFRVIHKNSISLNNTDDDDFEDIEYVEASLFDPKIVNLEEENVVYQEEENVVHQEEEEVDLENIFQIQDVVLREKLLSINRLIANIESLNDNHTPDCVLNSSVLIPIFEESDNFLSDNFYQNLRLFAI